MNVGSSMLVFLVSLVWDLSSNLLAAAVEPLLFVFAASFLFVEALGKLWVLLFPFCLEPYGSM